MEDIYFLVIILVLFILVYFYWRSNKILLSKNKDLMVEKSLNIGLMLRIKKELYEVDTLEADDLFDHEVPTDIKRLVKGSEMLGKENTDLYKKLGETETKLEEIRGLSKKKDLRISRQKKNALIYKNRLLDIKLGQADIGYRAYNINTISELFAFSEIKKDKLQEIPKMKTKKKTGKVKKKK